MAAFCRVHVSAITEVGRAILARRTGTSGYCTQYPAGKAALESQLGRPLGSKILHALIELLSAGIEAVLSAGKDIPVGVCIACIRTPGVAKQALVLPLIGAARQKQCQTAAARLDPPGGRCRSGIPGDAL